MTGMENVVEVVAKALYRSVVSFPGELHPTLSELPKRQQDKYHRHARAVLAALTEAGTVEWGVQTKTFIDGDYDNMITVIQYRRITREVVQDHVDAMNSRYPIARVVSRLTLPWVAV